MPIRPPLPPRPIPPMLIRPFQIAFGVALGWVLRGRKDRTRD
jgi:hypothetical protein